MKNPITFLIITGLVLVAIFTTLFTVHQTEQAIVLQFGDPIRVVNAPGLHVKWPYQNIEYYERRLLDLDPPIESVILSDQKRIQVDSYSRYQISDPLKFYQALGSEYRARNQLSDIINSALRRVLGNVTLAQVLSAERDQIMINIRNQVDLEAQKFGVEIVDVRIRRADLPQQTSQNIYERMKSEREREAREFRAQGQEVYQQITSAADKESKVLIAEAERDAQIIRGEGDAQAYKIYADAFGQDPAFFSFYRSLQAYRKSLQDSDATFVLSPENEFFKYFNKGSTQ